ncbi:MAG: LamG domain-containing protein, partial [Tannerellaceae bacterium]|nr:LamG domain-containing protein [Tannerellaceae bacterium]
MMKRLMWIIPAIIFCCITGMYIPSETDGLGSDNDKAAKVKEKIVARWSFDAPNAGRNSVSDQYHARIGKKIGIVPGVTGNAVQLSPRDTTGKGIEIPPGALPADLRELTFSAWIAPKAFGDRSTVIRKEDAGVHGENRLSLAIQNKGKFLSLGINCGGNYAECDALISPEELCDGNWHLVAGTFDGRMMRVYLDGNEIGSFERQAPLNTVYDFTPIKQWRDDIASSRYETLEEATVRGVPFFIGS